MEALTKNYEISLSGAALIIIFAIAVAGLILSVLFIQDYFAEKHQSKSNTGFLGKPLFQFTLFAITIGAIIGSIYLIDKENDILIQANKQIEIKADYVVERDNMQRRFKMTPVPIVDGKEWNGSGNSKFDIIVNIQPSAVLKAQGQNQIDIVHANRTQNYPSQIDVPLLPGDYIIKIIVSFNGESYQEEFPVSIT